MREGKTARRLENGCVKIAPGRGHLRFPKLYARDCLLALLQELLLRRKLLALLLFQLVSAACLELAAELCDLAFEGFDALGGSLIRSWRGRSLWLLAQHGDLVLQDAVALLQLLQVVVVHEKGVNLALQYVELDVLFLQLPLKRGREVALGILVQTLGFGVGLGLRVSQRGGEDMFELRTWRTFFGLGQFAGVLVLRCSHDCF